MSSIKTSDPNMNLKPVELTPSELDSVTGGNTAEEKLSALFMLLNNSQQQMWGGGLTQKA
jgi:hypothetical protein